MAGLSLRGTFWAWKAANEFVKMLPSSSGGKRQTTKQVLVWLYTQPSNVHIIEAPARWTVDSVREFVKNSLPATAVYELQCIMAGDTQLTKLSDLTNQSDFLDYSIVICTPDKSTVLNVQSGDELYHVKVNIMDTVQLLKSTISMQYSFPIPFLELLCDGKVMKDNDLLLDHKVNSSTIIRMVLQPQADINIQVLTFWGGVYRLYVNPLSTPLQLLKEVIARVSFAPICDLEIKLPKHLVALVHGSSIMDFNTCICRYGVEQGSVVKLVSLPIDKDSANVTLKCFEENTNKLDRRTGESEGITIKALPYDTWFMVALKLHGVLKTPVDCLQIFFKHQPVKVEYTLEYNIQDDTHQVLTFNVTKIRPTKWDMSLKVECNSVTHQVGVLMDDTVSQAKDKLAQQGISNMKYYKLMHKKSVLDEAMHIFQHSINSRSRLHIKLGSFPVIINFGARNFTINTSREEVVGNLIKQVKGKLENVKKLEIYFRGTALSSKKDYLVSECGIYINSQLYLQPVASQPVPHLVAGKQVIPLPQHLNMQSLQLRQMGKVVQQPHMLMKTLAAFYRWRFADAAQLHADMSPDVLDHLKRRTTAMRQSLPHPPSIIERKLQSQGYRKLPLTASVSATHTANRY